MIDRVHFENFKSLADVTIDLGRFTVLVGPNGCGKSSVLQAINAHALTGRSPGNANEMRFRLGRFDVNLAASRVARVVTEPVMLSATRSGDELSVRFRPDNEGTYEVDVWLTGAAGGLSTTLPSNWTGLLTVLNDPRVQRFNSCVYLRLEVARLAADHVPDEAEPTLRPDGHNLASVLAWMKGADEERLAGITSDLSAVVPGLRRVRIKRKATEETHHDMHNPQGYVRSIIADTFELEFDDGRSIPADLLSEGTLLSLGLLTKLWEPSRPSVVLLDDIDRGLHLDAQAKLISAMRTLLARNPELQIVCTTHSPYLLDLFEPEEVRVMALDAERRTRVRALSEHPDIAKWKIGTQTGELWATLGESWVLEAGAG